ncbi:MAG: hypothetical protein U5K51_17220 [Flavobacteriaceae bacterium]|nr:hypothetical protein [Flavobacteriaceae bacterium]
MKMLVRILKQTIMTNTKRAFLIVFGFLGFFACEQNQDKIDWVFVEGGSFEQGKNQIIISPMGDRLGV